MTEKLGDIIRRTFDEQRLRNEDPVEWKQMMDDRWEVRKVENFLNDIWDTTDKQIRIHGRIPIINSRQTTHPEAIRLLGLCAGGAPENCVHLNEDHKFRTQWDAFCLKGAEQNLKFWWVPRCESITNDGKAIGDTWFELHIDIIQG